MERQIDIYFIVGFLGAMQGYFLALYFFSRKAGHKLSNRLFAVFLFLISNAILAYALLYSRLALDFPWFNTGKNMIGGLFGPVLYLYVRSVCDSRFRLKWIHLLLTLPVLLQIYWASPRLFLPIETQREILTYFYLPKSRSVYDMKGLAPLFYFLVPNIILLVYDILCVKHVVRFNRLIKQNYSFIQLIKLNWLLNAIYIFLLIWLIDSGLVIFNYFSADLAQNLMLKLNILNAVVVYYIAYRSIHNHPISIDVYESKDAVKTIDADKKAIILESLKTLMTEQKPFLDPTLTINQLAEMLEVSKRVLSQVINEELGMNFYDFVNSYRVTEIQQFLQNPKFSHYKLLAIANDCGFKTKSAFNSAFKKITGQTPSEYKLQLNQ